VYSILMIDLVAKKTGTKVSAQWSNDETVHQILVDLLNENTLEKTKELLRKVCHIMLQINSRKQLRNYD
jgi:hypothetical protein